MWQYNVPLFQCGWLYEKASNICGIDTMRNITQSVYLHQYGKKITINKGENTVSEYVELF